eukprot:4199247-Prymnesium_polylepis.1
MRPMQRSHHASPGWAATAMSDWLARLSGAGAVAHTAAAPRAGHEIVSCVGHGTGATSCSGWRVRDWAAA